jgi:hypothetical protein
VTILPKIMLPALAALALATACTLSPRSDTRAPEQRPYGDDRSAGPAIGGYGPLLGSADFEPRPVTAGQPTGTFVGNKVVQLRGDLQLLQRSIATHNDQLQEQRAATGHNAEAFHGIIAAIQARLQVGTTPGNPILNRQWGEAQSGLNRIDNGIVRLRELSNRVSTDGALASFLLDSVRSTYGLSGAVEEDHRQLAILEDEVNRTQVLIDRLLSEIESDIERQSTYVARERRNMQTLSLAIKSGEIYGDSLAMRATASERSGGFGPASAMASDGRRPLVVIRFDRPTVDFEQPLYQAMSEAIDRRPDASFEVVAVTPAGRPGVSGAGAKRNAERVLRSLRDMGMPAERLRVTARTSDDAHADEVHIYVL